MKTEAVEKWPTLVNIKDVRAFLGLASCYCRFIYSRFLDSGNPDDKPDATRSGLGVE